MNKQNFKTSSLIFSPEKEKEDEREKIFKQNIKELIDSKNINTYLGNFKNIIQKFTNAYSIDYQTYIFDSNNMFNENINDDRIAKYNMLNVIYNNRNLRCGLPISYFNKISLNPENLFFDDFIYFWRNTTNNVVNKKILGFPLCIFGSDFEETNILGMSKKVYNLYFLKFQEYNNTGLQNIVFDKNINSIIFQKMLIFYTLNLYSMVSSNYFFEEIPLLKPTVWTFKIKSLLFNIPINKIIILSPKTNLIISKVSIEDYIHSLDEFELKNIQHKDVETFYEFFIKNYLDYFYKTIYNTRSINAMLDMSTQTKNLSNGELYILKNPTIPVFIIVLNSNETHIHYLVLFDSTLNKPTLSMAYKIIQKNQEDYIFYFPDLIIEKPNFNYFIG